MHNSYFCVTPQKSSVNVFLMRNIKKHCHKNVIVHLFNLIEENLEEQAFVIFPTSIMALFENHQRFKGHFLNKLRFSYKCPN